MERDDSEFRRLYILAKKGKKETLRFYPFTVILGLLVSLCVLKDITQHRADPPFLLTWYVRLWWATTPTQLIGLLLSSTVLSLFGVLVSNVILNFRPSSIFGMIFRIGIMLGGVFIMSYGVAGIFRLFWRVFEAIF